MNRATQGAFGVTALVGGCGCIVASLGGAVAAMSALATFFAMSCIECTQAQTERNMAQPLFAMKVSVAVTVTGAIVTVLAVIVALALRRPSGPRQAE